METEKTIRTLARLGNNPLSYRELVAQGITAMHIERLLKKGEIHRVSRGVYQRELQDFSDEEQFRSATLRVGYPCAVALLSALTFYHLTDEIPKKVWLLAPTDKRTRFKDIRLFRTRNPNWTTEILQEDGYRITSLERTLVDSLLTKHLRMPIATQALRTALREKKTTLAKVMKVAKKLEVAHRIVQIIEVLL